MLQRIPRPPPDGLVNIVAVFGGIPVFLPLVNPSSRPAPRDDTNSDRQRSPPHAPLLPHDPQCHLSYEKSGFPISQQHPPAVPESIPFSGATMRYCEVSRLPCFKSFFTFSLLISRPFPPYKTSFGIM